MVRPPSRVCRGCSWSCARRASSPFSPVAPLQGDVLHTLRVEYVLATPHQLGSGASLDDLETCCLLAGTGQVTGLKHQASLSLLVTHVLGAHNVEEICALR